MPEEIPIGKVLRIRECGFDEYWLRDQVYDNPSALQLGELEALSKEKTQSVGGRLDLLLGDAEHESMYEVEVMLGKTDESHIIRTIAYWDSMRRRYPQRQHYAVLVAEEFERRFFDVIQVLSQSVPLIAVQANVMQSETCKLLSFTTVLNVYEEPGEPGSESDEPTTEDDWRRKAPWTLETAGALAEAVRPVCADVGLNFTKHFIALRVKQHNYFSLHKRSGSKSLLYFKIDPGDMDTATALLDAAGMTSTKKTRAMQAVIDKQIIAANREGFEALAELVRQRWEG